MSATTVKLLQAASEVVGGDRALARRLGIGEVLLAKFLEDLRELPDPLLLRAVDIILADRESRLPLRAHPAAQSSALAERPEMPENRGRGSGATVRRGSA